MVVNGAIYNENSFLTILKEENSFYFSNNKNELNNDLSIFSKTYENDNQSHYDTDSLQEILFHSKLNKIIQFNSDNNRVYKELIYIEINNKESKINEEDIKNTSINSQTNNTNNILFITNKVKENKNFFCGRKTDREKYNGRHGLHTKKNEDNIISKIKSFFGKSLYLYISKLIKGGKLLKLDVNINKYLKVDYNLNLFKKTLKNIFIETNISSQYKTKKGTNEELIKKIYEEKKEIEAIKILNLTYLEAFEIFRRNLKPNSPLNSELEKKIEGTNILNDFVDAQKLLEREKQIGKKNNEKNEEIEKYINDVKKLILGFEKWFMDKEN